MYGRTPEIFVTVVVDKAHCIISIHVPPLSSDVWTKTSVVVPPAPRTNTAWARITDAPMGIEISALGYVPAVVFVRFND
jgi:hypothetical protein